eukprot:TRINITY_DN21199_c0_g1_i1.p1 TRINITY_DN21199_c0_g1~~TRINITY_DN21199_c0_g1_i1.p1  ORF type:complete len:284 (+),score=84.77 TRINITY_DN21199_c0_g1_i1:57-908(+)
MEVQGPRQSKLRIPRVLQLPSLEKKHWNKAERLSAELLELLTACNEHVPTRYSRRDVRHAFVDGMFIFSSVTTFVKRLYALCPKTWPAVLFMMDKASREANLPITKSTVCRLAAAAAYLVLSTEDDDEGYAVARVMRLPRAEVEALGASLMSLLRAAGPAKEEEASWDDVVGLSRVGHVAAELPRRVRHLNREYALRKGVSSEALAGLPALCMNFTTLQGVASPGLSLLGSSAAASGALSMCAASSASGFCTAASSMTSLLSPADTTSFSSTAKRAFLQPLCL